MISVIDKKRLKRAQDVLNKTPEHHEYNIEHELHMHDSKKARRHKLFMIALVFLGAIGVVWFAVTHRYLSPVWYDNVIVKTIVHIRENLLK